MTREDIIRMAWEAELTQVIKEHNDGITTLEVPHLSKLLMFADFVAAAEREACALMVERGVGDWRLGKKVATAIRARGDE